MSIKTTITDNSTASVTVAGKTLTRRTAGGQVIYDGTVNSGSGGSGIVGAMGAINMIIPTTQADGSYNGTHEKFRPGENATCEVIFIKQPNWTHPKLYLRCTNHTRTELNIFTNEQQAIVEDYRIGTNGAT